MHHQNIQRFANGVRQIRYDFRFKATVQTTECVTRFRVFLTDQIGGQLVILNKPHMRSVRRMFFENTEGRPDNSMESLSCNHRACGGLPNLRNERPAIQLVWVPEILAR